MEYALYRKVIIKRLFLTVVYPLNITAMEIKKCANQKIQEDTVKVQVLHKMFMQ